MDGVGTLKPSRGVVRDMSATETQNMRPSRPIRLKLALMMVGKVEVVVVVPVAMVLANDVAVVDGDSLMITVSGVRLLFVCLWDFSQFSVSNRFAAAHAVLWWSLRGSNQWNLKCPGKAVVAC